MNDKQAMILGLLTGMLSVIAYFVYREGIIWPLGFLLVLLAVLMLIHTFQTWRRTRLPLATVSMALGTVVLGLAGGAILLGWDLLTASLEVLVAVCIAASIPPALLFAEACRSPEKWAAWKRRATGASLVEMVTGRHIPDLRDV